MEAAEAIAWLDQNNITSVRTEGVSIDGLVVGKHLNRRKFDHSLPLGPAISDFVYGLDMGGNPMLGWWADWRAHDLGDIHQRPDLATLVASPNRPGMASVAVDHVDVYGNVLPVCSRSLLKSLVERLSGHGLAMKATFEIECMLFTEPVTAGRPKHFRGLTPLSTPAPAAYLTYNCHQSALFMDEVVRRLDGLGIEWEAWNDEAAPGQVELNLAPADPLTIADRFMRARQVFREVGFDLGYSVTFMSKPVDSYGNGTHIHHSLTRDGQPAFHDASAPGGRSSLMLHWIGGLMATLPGAVSIMAPTINSYRRMVGFAAAPTHPSWAEDNKSTALRLISREPKICRIEHRVGGGEINGYLALAVILAGGLAGLEGAIDPPDEYRGMAWGLPEAVAPLPSSITKAAEALEQDKLLGDLLGADFVHHWVNTRRWEWLMFNTTGGDATSAGVTDWELDRYFELV